jgi:hypothetical protein
VELRGFEPLTPSMPWSFLLSADMGLYSKTQGKMKLSNS